MSIQVALSNSFNKRIFNDSIILSDDDEMNIFEQLDLLEDHLDQFSNHKTVMILDDIDDEFLKSPISSYYDDDINCENHDDSSTCILDLEADVGIWNDCGNSSSAFISISSDEIESLVRSPSTTISDQYNVNEDGYVPQSSSTSDYQNFSEMHTRRAVTPSLPHSRSCSINTSDSSTMKSSDSCHDENEILEKYNQSLRKLVNSMRRTDETRDFIKRQRLSFDKDHSEEQHSEQQLTKSNNLECCYQNPAIQDVRTKLLQSLQCQLNNGSSE